MSQTAEILAEAEQAFRRRGWEEALAGFQLVIDLEESLPENASIYHHALFMCGLSFIKLDHTEPASKVLLRLLKINDAHPGSYYGLGLRSVIIADRYQQQIEEESRHSTSAVSPQMSPCVVDCLREVAISEFSGAILKAKNVPEWRWIAESAEILKIQQSLLVPHLASAVGGAMNGTGRSQVRRLI